MRCTAKCNNKNNAIFVEFKLIFVRIFVDFKELQERNKHLLHVASGN